MYMKFGFHCRRLLTQLESFKPGQKSTPAGKEAGAAGDHVKYELFYRPEQAQFSRNAKVCFVELCSIQLHVCVNTSDLISFSIIFAAPKELVMHIFVFNSPIVR